MKRNNNRHKNKINDLKRTKLSNQISWFGLLVFMVLVSLSCGSDNMDVVDEGVRNSGYQSTPVNNVNNNSANDELKESITAILLDNGHTELIEALEYVNAEIYTQLIELFASQNVQHTVFAPNNEAFFKLYNCLGMKTQDISEIGDPGLIRDILLYHVAKGRQDANTIIPSENEREVETLFGKALTVKNDRTVQSVGSIAIIGPNDADKIAKNGIVHVISEVLLPIDLACQGANP
ncbi:fasciclin domain-containing protein [Lutimonas saemankumensis]|uniref:fasciclin domain-containing protein n=1 Tax=Lutimonas saemankumensis TaxID=483016 RepID=UPI001CD43469|nr:fasciclin domain-containing protein [Lutimonas saemankumensis]MCA0930868.1 fasciclin domain-containing protein [Lutimonas saemankumensis]